MCFASKFPGEGALDPLHKSASIFQLVLILFYIIDVRQDPQSHPSVPRNLRLS